MPILDMPLARLEQYKGTNPLPADFDGYWDAALAEMRAVDADATFTPADFAVPGAECFDLWFTGAHGARVHARHARPPVKAGEKIPAVLLFHGYSGASPEWSGLLNYVAAGFAVFALDVRGQGGLSEDVGGVKGTTYDGQIVRGLDEPDPQKLFFRDVFLDTAELAAIAFEQDFIDETRVCAAGGSQGGGLTLACAALEPRIRRAAPMVPFLSDYKRVWEMDLDINAYRDIRYYFRWYDPLHTREEEIFTKLGYIDVHNLAHRIRADVLMETGLLDNVCPPSTQFAVYNNLVCRKKHLIYPDYGHDSPRGAADLMFRFIVTGEW